MTYRQRLRREGAALAGCGAVTAAILLLATEEALDGPASTVIQLALVALLLAVAAPLTTRRALAAAVPLAEPGAGEPTPLWQLPLIAAGLTVAFGVPVGWDAGLRVAGGCVLVGLAQAVLIERLVAAEERRSGRRFFRVPGSSLFTGTKLGSPP